MDSRTYLAESARTASARMHPDLVSPAALEAALEAAIAAGNAADRVKKALFYGRKADAPFEEAARTTIDIGAVPPELVHAALGIYTEAAELLENILEALRTRSPDAVNLIEETGDIEWYLAMIYRALGCLPEDVRRANIAKLRQRFPDRFERERANVRDIDSERLVLERHARTA